MLKKLLLPLGIAACTLGAADIDLSVEGLAALDHNFLRHKIPPFLYRVAHYYRAQS